MADDPVMDSANILDWPIWEDFEPAFLVPAGVEVRRSPSAKMVAFWREETQQHVDCAMSAYAQTLSEDTMRIIVTTLWHGSMPLGWGTVQLVNG